MERQAEAVYYAIRKEKRAYFAGPPTFRTLDYDNDGLFNSLSIEFPVHYPKGWRIAIHARLEDVTGKVIQPDVTVMAMNMVAKVDHMITIGVESERIVSQAADGPFLLRDIRLWDKRADRLIDMLPDVTSGPFSIASFDPPAPPEEEKLKE